MSQALRKLTATINKTNTMVIFINQGYPHEDRRDLGNPETTTGGHALKFYSSVHESLAHWRPWKRFIHRPPSRVRGR